jgi:hypothetical protein
MAPTQSDPLRPPDWRWLRARWLRETNKYARKGREDAETLVIKRYQSAKAACKTDLMLDRLRENFPGLYHSEELYTRDDLDFRWELEARLLARESFDDIAKKAGMDVDIVRWYEKTFYNVTDRIDNRSYIFNIAMGRSIHRGLFERDYDLLWKMLGYGFGPYMVDALTSRMSTMKSVTDPSQVEAAMSAVTDSTIVQKGLVAMMTMPISYNQGAILETYQRMKELQKSNGFSNDAHNLIVQNIHAALTALPFSTDSLSIAPVVADYNNQHGELRADELLAVGMGFDSKNLRESVNVQFPSVVKDGDNAKNQ